MNKSDNYLLLLIGVLMVSLIAVELIPLPEMSATPVSTSAPPAPEFMPPKMGSATLTSVTVISTSTLATVTVV